TELGSTGTPVLNANGLPQETLDSAWTARIQETHRTYFYAGTLDWFPAPDQKLTLTLVGTPSFNQEMKSQYGLNSFSADPQNAVESLTRVNTDANLHYTAKLLERRWQLDVSAGMHQEYLYGRSPNSTLNNLNEVQYSGANLWD